MNRTGVSASTFADTFLELTGNAPFPWQEKLYERIVRGDIPSSCNLPTGLGKTNVIAIWLIAMAHSEGKLPRRLVYVVNRRTVVDQATGEAENLRKNLQKPELKDLAGRLRQLCAVSADDGTIPPLAISTLRGQFADNAEWRADPARPAIIVGTVDMIGSRLLFSGYGCGFKSRPLHAGFLGQNSLIVHDEAHLEPAFQDLLMATQREQQQGRIRDLRPLRVMALSATSRAEDETSESANKPFELTEEEKNPPHVIPEPPTKPVHVVWRRQKAKKVLHLHENTGEKKLADEIADLALKKFKDSKRAVLVFLRKVDDVTEVVEKLRKAKQNVQQLTGTLRGLERDKLATSDPVFHRFLPKAEQGDETVYLVCTSAGEVGVNISADHLVCDLSTFDSMAQRFGRVNRFGDRDDTEIHVVCPTEFDEKNESDQRRKKTLHLLQGLNGDGSPKALSDLDPDARRDAFAPTPVILPVTDMLFDAWALTTIRDKLPGRPEVEPYLHGVEDDNQRETHVAWREEVKIITGELLEKYTPDDLQDLLDDYPLKPHELLRDRTDRVFKHLQRLAERHAEKPVWIVDKDDSVRVTTLREIAGKDQAGKDRKDALNGKTVLLPPSAGGLRNGLFDGTAESADDVADEWYIDKERTQQRRVRVWDDDPVPDGMRLVRTIDTKPDTDDGESADDNTVKRYWRWYELPQAADGEGSKTAQKPVLWKDHTGDVVGRVQQFIEKLLLPDEITKALVLAAQFHDSGKMRPIFQRLGNRAYDPADVSTAWAKSGDKKRSINLKEDYRHEFGSLLDVECEPEFQKLTDDMKKLLLHLIAAHHGYARPHFPAEKAFDPTFVQNLWNKASQETPQRFARLQRKYGRWGLAYLESLLRAADWAASAKPSEFVAETKEVSP